MTPGQGCGSRCAASVVRTVVEVLATPWRLPSRRARRTPNPAARPPRGKGRWCGLSPAMTTSVFVAQVASNTLITRFAAAVRRRLETIE